MALQSKPEAYVLSTAARCMPRQIDPHPWPMQMPQQRAISTGSLAAVPPALGLGLLLALMRALSLLPGLALGAML